MLGFATLYANLRGAVVVHSMFGVECSMFDVHVVQSASQGVMFLLLRHKITNLVLFSGLVWPVFLENRPFFSLASCHFLHAAVVEA